LTTAATRLCSLPAVVVVAKADEATSPADPHNDTTLSEISADITLDSVRDHTM
jgi:hypothetical protein